MLAYLKLFLALTVSGIQHGTMVMGAKGRLGILVAVTENLPDQQFCIQYFPELSNLTSDMSKAPRFRFDDLSDLTGVDTCEGEDFKDLTGKVALLSAAANTSSNCSIADRADIIETHHAIGVIADDTVSLRFNASEYTTHIFVTALYESDSKQKLLDIKKSHPNSKFIVYGPEIRDREFDASIVIIFCLATFTVGLGSLWSGYTKHTIKLQQDGLVSRRCSNANRCRTGSGSAGSNRSSVSGGSNEYGEVPDPQASNSDDVATRITPAWVVFFVAMMCTMLLLLYFFFNQLVYVIIGMFVFATVIATYACIEPLVMASYSVFPRPILQLPRVNLGCAVIHLEFRQFLLMVTAISISVVWAVCRKEDWAWALQDFLGVLFCINMLHVLRMPSLMICSILLGILFFYDIFFVFITPLFTKNGKSVMVEVATGGETGEQLPMVLKVPHMNHNPLSACWVPYSILGFGDILVPGLLLSYCHAFDLAKETPFKLYWTIANIFYSLSLVATFISLFLMDSAQPALLYIVPCTLLPIMLTACARGEFKDMWDGDRETQLVIPASSSAAAEKTDRAQKRSGGGGKKASAAASVAAAAAAGSASTVATVPDEEKGAATADDDCCDSSGDDEERGTEDEDKGPASITNAASDPSSATSASNQEDSQKLIE